MTIIDSAWDSIRQEGRDEHGWHVRQVYVEAPCEILAGIKQPGGIPGLLLEVGADEVPSRLSLPKSRGFVVDPLLVGGSATGRARFALTLADRAFEAVFAVLCEDTARAVNNEKRPRAAVRAWVNRLHVWQEFMARHGVQGLTEDRAVGLFGELLMMRNLLLPGFGPVAVQAWAGPKGEPNDYAFSGGYLEVKATIRQAPELIEISDVDQLDDVRGAIFLAHVRLRLSASGETLPQMISTVRAALAREWAGQLQTFDELLMAAGYIDVQADLYHQAYELNSVDIYHVAGNFPRLHRSDIPDGIRSLRYSVEVGACRSNIVDVDDALVILRGKFDA